MDTPTADMRRVAKPARLVVRTPIDRARRARRLRAAAWDAEARIALRGMTR